jgi:hypothetical protein
VIRRADPAALPPGRPAEIRALIDGIVVAPRRRLVVALTLTFGEDRISRYTVNANPARLGRLSISVLGYPFGL